MTDKPLGSVDPAGMQGVYSPAEVTVKYQVALHRSEEGICVWVPGLPGCVSQGATEEEALANIADAIREYLQVVMEQVEGAEVREIEVAA